MSYLFQLTWRAERPQRRRPVAGDPLDPALSPGRVLLAQIPLGQTPSLHLLRHPYSGFVRRLPRYYESVRLPVFVHHRLQSLDFPMRPENAGRSRVNPGSLNFRAKCVPTCQGHRPRRTPAKLAILLVRMLPSALCQGVGVLKLGIFRGSIAWPAVPPVYASYMALRPYSQDSEPVWLARPSPYDSCIRYTSPVPCLRTGLTLRHVTPKLGCDW